MQRHYEATLHFWKGKGLLTEAFAKRVTGVTGLPLRIVYVSDVPATPLLDGVDELVDSTLPRFTATLTKGRQRWQEVAATLTLESVGLQPLRPDEGYLFVHYATSFALSVCQHRLTLYDEQAPGSRLVHWQLRERTQRTSGTTFERLKLASVHRYNLPNPAAFRLESRGSMPDQATLSPIAQQLLNQTIC